MDVPGSALITGAGSRSGIGTASALAFAQEGTADIALLDIAASSLSATKPSIEQLSLPQACQVLTYTLDIADEAEVPRAVNDAALVFGQLDYVVNAVGMASKHAGGAAFANTVDWERVWMLISMGRSTYCALRRLWCCCRSLFALRLMGARCSAVLLSISRRFRASWGLLSVRRILRLNMLLLG
ncbi:hypothetical protein EKO04_011124 [Ascochyta lentis]|uniref:Uncharacterized protein n=1 Tax=Ascochyta lentis TaxID=205686 RepID=A0A8H7IUG8_9PLEO|nr:hypothetical protein EKO04_011124 [Ascochyta lentis]